MSGIWITHRRIFAKNIHSFQTAIEHRRTYFFDVRETKAGDYYLTITESKKFTHDDGSFHYKKHKIYLYKEDFTEFGEILNKATSFIVNEKGQEVISERHQKDYHRVNGEELNGSEVKETSTDSFTDVHL